jgi:hypothetical protein
MLSAMTTRDLMCANVDKFFEFVFTDGEKTVGRLLRVNERNDEFIYEMSSTNEPTRYESRLNRYSATFSDLVSAQLLDQE